MLCKRNRAGTLTGMPTPRETKGRRLADEFYDTLGMDEEGEALYGEIESTPGTDPALIPQKFKEVRAHEDAEQTGDEAAELSGAPIERKVPSEEMLTGDDVRTMRDKVDAEILRSRDDENEAQGRPRVYQDRYEMYGTAGTPPPDKRRSMRLSEDDMAILRALRGLSGD